MSFQVFVYTRSKTEEETHKNSYYTSFVAQANFPHTSGTMSEAEPSTTSKSDDADKVSVILKDTLARRRINGQQEENVLDIWLDGTIDNDYEDCQNIVKQLQHAVNNVKTFTHTDVCIECIQSSRKQRACLVMSGLLGHTHDASCARHVSTLFISCGNKKRHEEWAKQTVQRVKQSTMPMGFITSGKRTDQLDSSFMYAQRIEGIPLTIDFQDTHWPSGTSIWEEHIDLVVHMQVLPLFHAQPCIAIDGRRCHHRDGFVRQQIERLYNKQLIQ